MADAQVAIIGGGVVGLACAAVLARGGQSVVLLERHSRVGQETSSRNSGVIHAGLYYPTDSDKARLCVEGRKLLYDRCEQHAIAHTRCGKLVVACDEEQHTYLEGLLTRGLDNGAGQLRLIEGRELSRRAPAVSAISALWSPETGNVDVHGLMDSYRAEAREHGAELVMHTTVQALDRHSSGWRVRTAGADGEPFEVSADWIVNSAGLSADSIARRAGLDVDALGYRLHPCKGDYFQLTRPPQGLGPHLIYPVPVQAGLGIHITRDLGGKILAGPDTTYVDDVGEYSVDQAKAGEFAEAVRRYLPQVQDADLMADYAGIRPKLQGPGESFRDFVIEEASPHGAPRLVNLMGIESPGLTASEAIAQRVAQMIQA